MTESDPLIVGLGDWIPDLAGVPVCTGDGPLFPRGCFMLQSKASTIILGWVHKGKTSAGNNVLQLFQPVLFKSI